MSNDIVAPFGAVLAALGIVSSFGTAASGCVPRPEGCDNRSDCRYNRVCHPERRVCVWPGRIDGLEQPPPDGGDSDARDIVPPPDIDDLEVLFRDEFSDQDDSEWDKEYSTRRGQFRNGKLVFEGTQGSGRHDSHAAWTTTVTVDRMRGVLFRTRFKLGLENKGRDQVIRTRLRLLDGKTASADELGHITFYTRWEGRNGTLADKCRADNGREWCTYGGENPYIDDNGTTFSRDIHARNHWSRVDRSLSDIVQNRLDGVSIDDIEALQLRVVSRGAWGTDSRGSFDYVRLLRR